MAADSNGRPVEAGKKGMNGHAKAPASKPVKKAKGFSLFSTISRLLTWYSIITILLRCPSTIDLLTETSPKICKPYFQLRSVVAPHLEPYYHTYAAPYIDAAQPYYDTFDKRVITPAKVLGLKYGAPRVAQAQAFGQTQWETTLQPQVLKYQGIAKEKYDQLLGLHVDKAIAAASPYYDIAKTNALQTYYEHILPTYTTVQPYAVQGYGVLNDFTINTAIPYSTWAWTTGTVFLERIVWPKLRILYGENVEPQLVRIGERLGRYRDGKKLKAVVDEVDSSSSASSATVSFSSISSSVTSAHSTAPVITTTAEAEGSASTLEREKEAIANAQIVVAKDLKTWQEKFARAADEGSDELEERITEITDRQVQNQAQGVGKALIIQLEETVKSSLQTLKKSIISIVKDAKDTEASEDALNTAVRKAGVAIKEKAQAVRTWRQNYDRETNSLVTKSAETTFEILDHIRDLGLQEIGMRWAWTEGVTHKDWKKYHQLKNKFDEWRDDVEKVVAEHPGLEKARAASEEVESQAMAIAEDAAKELARLKETGRWKISTGDSSDDFSTKIMPLAAAAGAQKVVKKISELSEAVVPISQGTMESVISAASSSLADAASSASSVAASQVKNAQSAISSVSESIAGTPQGSVESIISVGSASASTLADKASSSIIGTSQGTAQNVTSVAKASGSSIIDQASSSIIGTAQGTAESAASVAKASASSIVGQASSSIIGTPQGSVESIISVAGESASSLSAKASSSIVGKEPGVVERASSSVKSAASVVSKSASSLSDAASSSISSGSSAVSKGASEASSSLGSVTSSIGSSLSKSSTSASSSISSAASSASSTASKKVWGGAMAAQVEARQIIFEDVTDNPDDTGFSEKLQSMANEAGDRFSDITKAVSEALLGPTSTQTVRVTKLAADKYSSALSAASVALYGTEQGTGESVSSVVASRYSDAVAAASSILYGTPTPITDSIAARATDAYSAALSRAGEHYSQARSVVSAQISGQPKPVHEEMFSSVEAAYSDSVAAASSRLQDVLSAASTAVYGTPTPAYQSVLASLSSVAQSKLSEGLSAASAQFNEAKSYAAAINTPAPTKQKLLVQIQEQYYAGIGMAHARYSEFISVASSAVLPTQPPFHESLYSKASANIVGTPTPSFQAALSTASMHYSSAVAGASSQLEQVIASIAKIGSAEKDAVPTSSLAALASSKYSAAVAEASSSYANINSIISEKLEAAASAASSAVIGSETPWTESVASAASENWEALITKASSQIYGAPTPYFITRRLLSEASEYAAQATDGVASQYSAVQSLISELVSGKEPDFTESVYSRFSSAYYTGAGQVVSSASSYASEAYASASSVAGSVFTPPPIIEAILDSASSHVNDAVEAASIQFYGTQKGTYEQATSAAASAYSSVQSVASEQIYGSSTGYAEAAQSSISDAAASAQKAISEAIYGTPTDTYESITNAAGETYASATSVIAENLSAATSMAGDQYSTAYAAISSAIYGAEKGAVESAQSRLNAAVESARAKLAEFAASAGEGANEYVRQASEGVEEFASSVSSAVSSATARFRDEL